MGWEWAIAVGGGLQVAGVVAAILDAIATKRRVQGWGRRPVTVEAHPAGLKATASIAAVGAVESEEGPTLEERVRALEEAMAAWPEELERLATTLRDGLLKELRGALAVHRHEVTERTDALETLVRWLTVGRFRAALVGAGLLIVGVAASTIGSVAS